MLRGDRVFSFPESDKVQTQVAKQGAVGLIIRTEQNRWTEVKAYVVQNVREMLKSL